jgi:hypothetical protein
MVVAREKTMMTRLRLIFVVTAVFALLAKPSIAFSASQDNRQAMAELLVEKHVRTAMSQKGAYKGHGFGAVEVLTPRDILYLKELHENRETAKGMREYFGARYDSVMLSYDTLISRQERTIREKKVRDNYKITHLFSVSGKENVQLMEAEFFLSANFHVKDVKLITNAELSKEDYDWFQYFMRGDELFVADSPQENQRRTNEIYNHFGSKLESAKGDKTELVYALVNAVRVIRIEQKFSPQSICSAVITAWMKSRPDDFSSYMPGDFSLVQALYQNSSGTEVLVGYSVFHRFSRRAEDGMPRLDCLYFELDPWFVVAGTMIVESPFDKYFEKK